MLKKREREGERRENRNQLRMIKFYGQETQFYG